ncbi:MAG: membrane protease YdiL (CAAX protease family) [Verrucomicrobiales bacterium]|jgi:membrane protease YdiL (CAAX protease family)
MSGFRQFWLGYGLRFWPYIAMLLGLWWLHSAWAAAVIYHVGIALGLAMRPSAIGQIKLGWNWPLAGLSVVVGAMIFFSVWLITPMILPDSNTVPRALNLTGLGSLNVLIWFAIYSTIVNPVLEELCWREIVHPVTSSCWRPHVRDFEFMAYHLVSVFYLFPWNWVMIGGAIPTLAGAAWIWRIMRDRFGGLAIPIFSHALADAAIIGGAILITLDR